MQSNILNEVTHTGQDSIRHYKELVNGREKEIAYQKTAVSVTKEGYEAKLSYMQETYKDLESRLKTFKKTDAVIGSVNTFNSGSMTFVVKEIPCLEKPDTMSIDTTFLKIDMVRHQRKLVINNVFVPDTVISITGIKKTPWYKKDEYRLEIIHSNPKIHTINLQSATFKPQKKWHETRAFNAGLGAALIIALKFALR